jgi:hypothetical protein
MKDKRKRGQAKRLRTVQSCENAIPRESNKMTREEKELKRVSLINV